MRQTAIPAYQIDGLEQTRIAIDLLELRVPAAFREARMSDVFPTDLTQSVERTKSALGIIVDNLPPHSRITVRKDAEALFDVLEKACVELSHLQSANGHSREFHVLAADNLNQSAEEIVILCRKFSQSLGEVIDSFFRSPKLPATERDANSAPGFLTRFQEDLERRYPSTVEERIFARNVRNLALALIPGVGLAAEVISAQGRFARACVENNEELCDSARRELVSVLLVQSLALAANGNSPLIEAAWKGASIVSLLRVITNDTAFETDLLGSLSHHLLQIPGIAGVADTILSSNISALASECSNIYADFNSAFTARFGESLMSTAQS